MVSLCNQNGPPSPPKPLHKSQFICWHTVTVQFFEWVMLFETQLVFVYHLPCSSLWVEISTLAYEANKNCWAESLSVAYSTHIIQTKLMLKNWRYPQKLMFTAMEGPTDMPCCSAGVICRDCGVVTCNTQPSVYQKCLGHPRLAGILYSRYIVALMSLWKTFISRSHYISAAMPSYRGV
jgi:hypothetical protein